MADGGRRALVTPSHGEDAERLAFLRESLLDAGVDAPHVVIVPPEDLRAFARVPKEGLELVTTADVLPRAIERRRRRGRARWQRALFLNKPSLAPSGWWAQQLVKLAVGDVLNLDAWLCVDSDVFCIRDNGVLDVIASGNEELHEFVDFPVGPSIRSFHARSVAFLGLDAGGVDGRRTYVGQAVPLVSGVVARLTAHIERRSGRPWMSAMLAGEATEYTTYGLFSRHVDGFRDVRPVDRRWCWHFYDFDESTFESRLRAAADQHGVSFGMVHSRLGVDPQRYRSAVRAVRQTLD